MDEIDRIQDTPERFIKVHQAAQVLATGIQNCKHCGQRLATSIAAAFDPNDLVAVQFKPDGRWKAQLPLPSSMRFCTSS